MTAVAASGFTFVLCSWSGRPAGCMLLPVYVYLSNVETPLQVSSNWSFSFVEQNSALRHGVKLDWSRCACTLVFLSQRGNHLTDT
jgi:hypothetical protein